MASGIIVTGGAGFIGSTLLEALLRAGRAPLVCLDNFNDYYDPAVKRRNIRDAQSVGAVTVVEGDICDPAACDRAADAAGDLDCIVHLAARAGVRPSVDDPPLYARVNNVGTANMLELARRRKARRFVLASTSSVYGNCPNVPFSEDEVLLRPISPYAASKLGCELMAHTYHHLFDLSVICLRFFTAYGPRQRPDMAIHRFVRLMLAGEELPVFGDGETSRDYTYIDDIVAGVAAAVDATAGFEIVNLGNSSTVTLNDMVATIERVLGMEARVNRLPKRPGDVEHTWADVSKARRLLGYEPATDFEAGVRAFVDWFRARFPDAAGSPGS